MASSNSAKTASSARNHPSSIGGIIEPWRPESKEAGMLARLNGNGIDIAYRVQGEGKPIVFIHGHGFDSSSWQPQLDYFGRRYRAIAYDVRGHGLTDVPDWGYTMGEFANDAAALFDHLDIDRAVVVGHAMGGMIGMQLAVDSPSRVAGLALADTAFPADPPSPAALLDRFRTLFTTGLEPAANLAGPRFFGERFRANKPDFDKWWRDRFQQNHLAGLVGGTLAMADRDDLSERLATIAPPTLVIVGEHDEVTPPDSARRIAEALLGAALVMMPDVAHLTNEEDPETFNRVVEEFLTRIGW
jgi:3-oxoadipate enol-lactonase